MRSKNKELMYEIRKFADEFSFENRRSPSTREIAENFGIVKSCAYRYLVAMDELGLISYDGKNIDTKESCKASPDILRTPIIGSVRCGEPTFAEENFEEYVPLPVSLFGAGDFFILRANGNSMTDAGIDDGDLVIIRKQSTAEYGDIIVALVNNSDTTLKRYCFDDSKRRVYLHPENSTYGDIYPTSLVIQGVAVKVLKDLK